MAGTMSFSYSGTTITIDRPIFGYQTSIKLPFTIQEINNGLYSVYDAGATYDVRSCICNFKLNEADADELLAFIDTTARGQAGVSMVLPIGSGFFPFGPDKNQTGTWTVALEIIDSRGIGNEPYLYFDIALKITNQSTHPAYTPGADETEGSITIGTVTEVMFPQDWFRPENKLGVYQSLGMSGVAKFTDRGQYSDSHDTAATFRLTQTKAAALVAYLTGTARANTFTLTTADNQYAFGMRSGASGSYTVRLVQDEIIIQHDGYNDFKIGLNLSREAIL